MTIPEIEAALELGKCAVVADGGDFALVYPYGFEGRQRAHDLAAKTRDGALTEAWAWLHPEIQIAEQIEIIQRVVARDFGETVDSLCNGGRHESLATGRQVAMALARMLTPASTIAVGAAFNRDHSTVIYAARVVESRITIDGRFAARVAMLREACLSAFATTREKEGTA